MIYLIAFKTTEGTLLALNLENELIGSENIEEAKKLLPNYDGYHKANYQWSMSAAIHWLSFNPKLLKFENLQEVEKVIVEMKATHLQNVSGSIRGIMLKSDYIPDIVEISKLITDKVNKTLPFYEQTKT